MALKLDMSKAFDIMEWPFLLACLQRLGFSDNWCQLVRQCISTVSTSVLLNGSPEDIFKPTRGLR